MWKCSLYIKFLVEVKFSKSNVQKSNFKSVLPAKIPPGTTDGMLTDSESVDELFVATFDSIRDSVADAIRNICDLIGELMSLSTFYDILLFLNFTCLGGSGMIVLNTDNNQF